MRGTHDNDQEERPRNRSSHANQSQSVASSPASESEPTSDSHPAHPNPKPQTHTKKNPFKLLISSPHTNPFFTHNDLPLPKHQILHDPKILHLALRRLDPRLRALHKIAQDADDKRHALLVRVAPVRLLQQRLEQEREPREARHRAREEGHDVALADARVLRDGLEEGAVRGVALLFGAVARFREGVVFYIGFVGGLELEGG